MNVGPEDLCGVSMTCLWECSLFSSSSLRLFYQQWVVCPNHLGFSPLVPESHWRSYGFSWRSCSISLYRSDVWFWARRKSKIVGKFLFLLPSAEALKRLTGHPTYQMQKLICLFLPHSSRATIISRSRRSFRGPHPDEDMWRVSFRRHTICSVCPDLEKRLAFSFFAPSPLTQPSESQHPH